MNFDVLPTNRTIEDLNFLVPGLDREEERERRRDYALLGHTVGSVLLGGPWHHLQKEKAVVTNMYGLRPLAKPINVSDQHADDGLMETGRAHPSCNGPTHADVPPIVAPRPTARDTMSARG
jgi:hypothetical protein